MTYRFGGKPFSLHSKISFIHVYMYVSFESVGAFPHNLEGVVQDAVTVFRTLYGASLRRPPDFLVLLLPSYIRFRQVPMFGLCRIWFYILTRGSSELCYDAASLIFP